MAKNKKKFPIFVITLFVGLGVIGFALFEADFDVGTLTSFSILTVPIDETTGGILGTIVLGAPDVKPFEQAGTMIGVPFTSRLFPNSPCTNNLTGGNMFPRLAPDFGRRLSGERNQLDPIWWGSRDTGITDTRDCAFAYAQWDIVDIPNDFVATSIALKLDVIQTRGIRNTNNPPQQCVITLQDFNLDTIADAGVINKLYEGLVVTSGTWCNKLGVKTFQFSSQAVDLVNDAISGGAFSQGVRSDKLLLGFVPKLFDNLGTGKNQISTQYWKTEGSLFLTGSSPPIKCDIGFSQVGFRCVPILCDVTESLNRLTNQCETIMCEANEDLTIFEEPVACIALCIDDPSTPEIECGSSCPPNDTIQRAVCVPQETFVCDVILNCQEGTRETSNGCSCELIECPTGQELIGDQCQSIVCPTNTILSGNNCVEMQCPSGQVSSNNVCITESPIDCADGFKELGDQCVPILDCPAGTEPFENNCRQIVPDLLMISGIDPSMFLIIGFVIAGISTVGIAVRRR